jgi:hypothetical protein
MSKKAHKSTGTRGARWFIWYRQRGESWQKMDAAYWTKKQAEHGAADLRSQNATIVDTQTCDAAEKPKMDP